MIRYKKLLSIFLLLIFVSLLFLPIFSDSVYVGNNQEEISDMLIKQYKSIYENLDVTVLRVQYVTEGTIWKAVASSNEKIQNKDVILLSLFNPRHLKANENFDIDFHSYVVVVSSFSSSIPILRNIQRELIIPRKIIICKDRNVISYTKEFQNRKGYYQVKDLNIMGILISYVKLIIILIIFYGIIKVIIRYLVKMLLKRKGKEIQ